MKKGIILAAAALATAFALIMAVPLFFGGGVTGGCVSGAASPTAAAAHAPVDGFSGDQLVNATKIINAGASLGLNSEAQTIGVMTAIGEPTLRVIDHGDTAGPDSRGLFQQRANGAWGSYADRMDPTTSATNFFKKLMQVPNWQSMSPSAAAHAVQGNADPNHYAKFYDAAKAVLSALTGTDTACAAEAATNVGGNSQQLAAHLVDLTNQGKITWLSPSHFPEVQAIADGQPRANCNVDPRILQVITVATQTFNSIGISDVNRLCTGQRPGAGDASAHVVNGGGHAVDFYAFNGTPTTGADANAIKMLRTLAPVMADKSGVGQSNCRAASRTTLDLPMKQFADTCNHLHVQVDPYGSEPMKLTNERTTDD